MSKALEALKDAAHNDTPQVPTKADILHAIQYDSSRAGLQLEWMLDRCATHERLA